MVMYRKADPLPTGKSNKKSGSVSGLSNADIVFGKD
jgi:hypothetical protein